jgi:DNA replication protein DnaC
LQQSQLPPAKQLSRFDFADAQGITKVPFSDWDQIFDNGMMAVPAIDRLVHHATILEMGGESYRMKASLQRQQFPTMLNFSYQVGICCENGP